MFKCTHIDHVAINTDDMEATLQFYCGILGMRLARTSLTGDGRRHYNIEIGGGNAFAVFDGASLPEKGAPQLLNHFALPVATAGPVRELRSAAHCVAAPAASLAAATDRGGPVVRPYP